MTLRAPIRRVLLLAVVALASPVVCAAPELFVDLQYQPDPDLAGCPSEEAFRAMIGEQLGYDPFRAGAEQKVVARARAAEHGLQGHVEWYDASGNPRGERELGSESTDCAALARAMSFAIAGLAVPGIRIINPECVSKSYPGFWSEFEKLEGTV